MLKSMTQPWRKVASTWNKKHVSLQATHWRRCMLLTGLKPRERTWCWVQCWTGWRHRSRQIWRCSWQNMSPVKKANWSYGINRILQFIRALVPMLNTHRWNWRSPALHGPEGTLCCCSEWVRLRCRSSRAQPCPVLVVGILLVARNDQPGAAVHEILHTLLAVWGQIAESTPTPDCVHCSNESLAHRLF